MAYLEMCMELCDEKFKSGEEMGFYTPMKCCCDRRLKALGRPTIPPKRIVDVDFEITNTDLVHTYDIDSLQAKVESLFKWHNDPNEREIYMAPFFPLVQSNGMGKTKLLYELRNRLRQGSEYSCEIFLCQNGRMALDSADHVFSQSIDFQEVKREGSALQNWAALVGMALDTIVAKVVGYETFSVSLA
jgi:hypothetical protein